MIYSKKLQTYIPVQVESQSYKLGPFGRFTNYIVKDNKIPVGFVDIQDTFDGIHVEFIKNQNPELYSGFGKIADQIEVEHCLKRGLINFNIVSEAALNSNALHYLRGKRFYSKEAEAEVRRVIAETPKGQEFNTRFLGKIGMYMPQELIKKYIEIIKKSPLLLK